MSWYSKLTSSFSKARKYANKIGDYAVKASKHWDKTIEKGTDYVTQAAGDVLKHSSVGRKALKLANKYGLKTASKFVNKVTSKFSKHPAIARAEMVHDVANIAYYGTKYVVDKLGVHEKIGSYYSEAYKNNENFRANVDSVLSIGDHSGTVNEYAGKVFETIDVANIATSIYNNADDVVRHGAQVISKTDISDVAKGWNNLKNSAYSLFS